MAELDVPVALFIYNRPTHVRETFARVRDAQPSRLFVVADGPKTTDDDPACEAARSAVISSVDWPCEVHTLLRQENIGTARSVSGGLDWVFSQVDRAIILEDDCVADPSFFRFCQELLQRYDGDHRVMQISGTNVAGSIHGRPSYGFTRYGLPCWGWATWARAWTRNDFTLANWELDRDTVAQELGPSAPFWIAMVDRYRLKLHGWDVQWNASIWKHGGRIIMPSVNLVGNTGYGEAATFTRVPVSRYSDLPRGTCSFPLVEPSGSDPVLEAAFDRFVQPMAIDLIEELGHFYRSTGQRPVADTFGPASAGAAPPATPTKGLASLMRSVSGRS